MLHGVFQTKERRIMIALLALILLVTGIFIYITCTAKKRYEEQTVMAEKFLEAGNYEQAIQAYLKAMSMKNSNHELLSIGLAEAYSGVNNYEKALEILRNSYMKTGSNTVKEKIEIITSQKVDHEFIRTITHADTYYANKEYEKAITEYEKAKSIKRKEVVSYERIAEAYIAMDNYTLAREEIMEGLALTQSDKLDSILEKVDSYLLKSEYDELVNSASEYIVQENYEEAISIYLEAIRLLPKEDDAYNLLADVYIAQGEYDKIIGILKNTLQDRKSNVLEETLERAKELRDEKEQRQKILKGLMNAVTNADTDKILKFLDNTFFTMKIAGSEPVYYSLEGEGIISSGTIMIVYDQNNIYAGEIKDGMKKDLGIYFIKNNNDDSNGWYYYKGEWNNDIPNGMGMTKEERRIVDESGISHIKMVVTEGTFLHGTENDQMKKTFYQDGEEVGTVSYLAKNGIPQPVLNEEGIQILSENGYAIGEWSRKGKQTGELYTVEQNTLWGVKTYVKN